MNSKNNMAQKNIRNSQISKKLKQEKQWYVFYLCPRAEKRVRNDLVKRDYEVFLPTVKTLKVWKNRQKKMIEETLFPGYIFVYTNDYELYNINRCNRVVTYIKSSGKPSIIPLKDIEGIKKMLEFGQDVCVDNSFKEGEMVRIIHGPLIGHEGILVKQKGKNRFGIQLKEINQTVLIDISTNLIEKK